ncbi:MAG: hypothetical protein AAF512_25000, partial [Pseudomonadota bacterium]
TFLATECLTMDETRHYRMRPITTNYNAELYSLKERQAALRIQIANARHKGTWHVDLTRELTSINKRLKKIEQLAAGNKEEGKPQHKPTF